MMPTLHDVELAAMELIEQTDSVSLNGWVDLTGQRVGYLSYVVICEKHGTELQETADEALARKYYSAPKSFCVHCRREVPAFDWRPKPSALATALRALQAEANRDCQRQPAVTPRPKTTHDGGAFADFINTLRI